MPLVRTSARNVYGLGAPELYRDADKEDPKVVLDGVAVAGLVGILRQLGDLAEFAAEVFHGLQEQVMVTSSRSNRLVARVQKIEAALPPLEKSVLAQRSHLHFAYTAGSNWHARVRTEQNHFIYDDLPRFIMDSYEECRGPPRLHLLDKFDTGGPGSCLKRYSDPTFFKRASVGSDEEYIEKVLKEKKGRKIKKKRSWRRNGEVSRSASMPNYGSRNLDRRPSLVHSFCTYDTTLKSDLDTRHGSGQREFVSQPRYSIQPEDGKSETVSSPPKMQHNQSFDYSFLEERSDRAYNDNGNDLSQELTDLVSTSVAWNLKMHPDAQEPKGSFDSMSQLHFNNILDHAFHEERSEVVCDDIDNGVSEEQAGHCTSSVTWNDKTGCDKQESRESFSSPFQIQHDALLDCASPDWKGDDEYSDMGNRLPDEQIGRNLLSVACSGNMSTAEVASKEVFSSPLQTNPNASAEDASPDEKLWVISDEESNNFRQEQVVPNLPFLTSSVKNETLDPIILKYDNDESLETGQENLLLDTQVLDFAISENIEQQCSEPEAEIIPRSTSCEGQFDDIESETDNFMDALNTIESESETDLDCQRRRAVELESSLKTTSALNGTLGIREELSHLNLSTNTPEVAARNFGGGTNFASADSDPGAFSSSGKVKCEEIPENISSECGEFLSSTQIARTAFKPDSSLGVTSSERSNILEASQVEPLGSNHITSSPRGASSGLPTVSKILCGPFDSEKPPPQLLGTPPVKFWTNGGLLGLEPSKPPDGVINTVGQVYEANQNEVVGTLRQEPVPVSQKHAEKQDSVQNKSRDKADCQNSAQAVGISIKNISSRFSAKDLDVKLEKSGNLYQQNCTDKPLQSCLSGSGIMTSSAVGPVSLESQTIGSGQENGKNSSRILELGNRLLTNGFHGKLSLGWNDNTDSVSSVNTGINEPMNDYQYFVGKTFSGRIKDFPGSGSSFTSPSSSPPLGHMKISFQPIDGIEASKLKLRFPDRNNIHENNGDIFPSFQLVPEPSIPLQEAGSDSDDDTFSRSSPDLSDDYLSRQSESNSEQWESGNSPNLKDQEVYDALQRISLTESTSTSLENGQTSQQVLRPCNGRHIPFAEYSLEGCQSDNLFDLPVLDTQHSSFKHGVGNALTARDLEPLFAKESTSPPPPPPPIRWQSTQSHLDDEQDYLHNSSENHHVFDHKELGSTISHQPKPPPFKQHQVIEAAFILKSKQPNSIDTTGQKLIDHAKNSRGINEKEDFLHQIRAKSFNLRRTAPAKQAGSSGPPASVKVTAILEKANAIRQAVGSDDGEDNWSDT